MRLATCLATGLLAAAPLTASAHGHTVTAWRGLVADAETGAVTVVDLIEGEVVERFDLAGPARLYRGPDGSLIYAVQRGADTVSVIDSGIAFEDHGDHDDIIVHAPALLDITLTGPEPVHFNVGGDMVAVFFDGDGSAGLWSEAAIRAGEADPLALRTSAHAHHGVAKPKGAGLALSIPTDGERLPDAIALLDAEGAEIARIACPRLHGEGATGAITAFGCADGVALFDGRSQPPVARHIPYGAALPEERMVRNLWGGAGYTVLVGDFGPDGMLIIDPTDDTEPFHFAPLPAARMHAAMNPQPGDTLFVMVQDGRLLKLSALTGRVLAEAAVTGPYAMDRGVTRPRIATAGTVVLVSDPAAGAVVVIDAGSLKVLHRVETGGAPFDVVVTGGTGHVH